MLYEVITNKIIGGCTYFVTHPGGRSFDTYPVNSLEAESRKMSRFWDFGYTPSSAIEERDNDKEASSNNNARITSYNVCYTKLLRDFPILIFRADL